ncbi:hypothetical protein FH972_026816 [Carpinus fangiana]|uniref:Bulb-type lectin domain-containing protein n=1 Tax=Carpinus fangiana TaxID=176857 RepID=A0A5N6L566_9ROSI|nr:hypothetical protein FH972_026816 [Carpinus fangiana]
MIRRISPLIASLLLLFCLALHFPNATLFLDTIPPGQSLNTSDSVVSAERRFGLGFFSPENSTKHYVVIYKFTYWYVSNDDIVWVANREHPFPNSSVILTFNSDGNLVISDVRSLHVLTNTSGGNDTYAKLLDTGWSLITSGKSDEDPAPGLFSLQYLGSRKEVILIMGSEQYWSSPLIDHLADIFVVDGDYFTWPISNYTNGSRRIRLDISGNLLLQTWMIGRNWFSFCLNYNNNINCTATDTIRPGQSLSTSETIVSANGREDPFLNSSAVLTLDPDGNLVISDGKLLHVLTNTTSAYAMRQPMSHVIVCQDSSPMLKDVREKQIYSAAMLFRNMGFFPCLKFICLLIPSSCNTNSTNGTVTDTGFKNMKDIGNNQSRKIIIPTASITVLVTLGLFVYYVTEEKA